MMEYFEYLKSLPVFTSPVVNRLIVYTTVVDALGVAGYFPQLIEMIRELKQLNIALDARFYRALLNAANLHKKMDLFHQFAQIWLEDRSAALQAADIERVGISKDLVIDKTARRYVWAGRWLDAVNFLEQCFKRNAIGARIHVLKLLLSNVPNINSEVLNSIRAKQ